MWARGYNAGSKEKPIIKQAYYLKYRLDGVQQLRKIGIFAPKVVPGNKTKDLLTPAEAMALAENIVSEAKADNDYFAKEQVLDTTAGKALRERLKDFFEAALFDEAQMQAGAKLKWMSDKARLTYFPENIGKSKQVRTGANVPRKDRKKDGSSQRPEPSYNNWRLSKENPEKFPVIDKPNYWNYVGCYNNFIAKSKIKIKLPGYQKAVLLREIPYNKIPIKNWVTLHKNITTHSVDRAEETLQMLRVFYNWLIEPKQGNDPKMRNAENPITEALSVPKVGLKQKKENKYGGKWHGSKPPENVETLSDKEINRLILAINSLCNPNPKTRDERRNNRNILSIFFRLLTGARPDVMQVLKWSDINSSRKEKILVSKGQKSFPLNIKFCKKLVFDRIEELKSREPNHPYIFASWKADGTPSGVADIRKNWAKVFKAAGLPEEFDYYNIKHTAANFMNKTTGDVEYIADSLGITKQVLIERYLRSGNKAEVQEKLEVAYEELISQATKEEKGLKVVH